MYYVKHNIYIAIPQKNQPAIAQKSRLTGIEIGFSKPLADM
jgi:hypothetical protein